MTSAIRTLDVKLGEDKRAEKKTVFGDVLRSCSDACLEVIRIYPCMEERFFAATALHPAALRQSERGPAPGGS